MSKTYRDKPEFDSWEGRTGTRRPPVRPEIPTRSRVQVPVRLTPLQEAAQTIAQALAKSQETTTTEPKGEHESENQS